MKNIRFSNGRIQQGMRGGERTPLPFNDPRLVKALQEDTQKGGDFFSDLEAKTPKPKQRGGSTHPDTNFVTLYAHDTFKRGTPVNLPMDGGCACEDQNGEGIASMVSKAADILIPLLKKFAKKTLAVFKKTLPKMLHVSKKLKLGTLGAGLLADKLDLPPAIRAELLAGVATTGYGKPSQSGGARRVKSEHVAYIHSPYTGMVF